MLKVFLNEAFVLKRFIHVVLLLCSHGSHKAKDSDWCGLGILWGHHGTWPCLNEGKFRAIGPHSILQHLLIWFSGQLQIWKATCLKHPKSLKTYPTKPWLAFSALHSSLHFKGLEMNPTFPWNQPSPGEHGMTAHHIPTKHMTKALCWPSLGQLHSQVPRGLILEWDHNMSTASTCWAGMGAEGRLRSPKEDFGSLIIV